MRALIIILIVLIPLSLRAGNSNQHIDNLLKTSQSIILNKPDSAYETAKKALDLSMETNYDQGAAQAHLFLGDILSSYGLFFASIKHYKEAIHTFKELEDFIQLAHTHNQLGKTYYESKNTTLALKNYQQALNHYQSQNYNSGIANTLGNLGHYHEKMAHYDSALFFQNKALNIFQQNGDSIGVNHIRANIGSIFEDLEKFDSALVYFESALEYNLKTNNLEERIDLLNNVGDVFRKTGNHQTGLSYSRKALLLAREMKNKPEIQSALKDMSKALFDLNQKDSAYLLLNEAHEVYKEIYLASNSQQIAGLEMFYKIKQKENQIEILKRDRKISRTSKLILILGVVSLIIIILILLVVNKNKIRQKQRMHELEKKVAQTELEAAQKKEKSLQEEVDLKNNALTSYALQSVQHKKVLKDIQSGLKRAEQSQEQSGKNIIKKLNRDITQTLKEDKDWDEFKLFFEQVHPNFLTALGEKAPSLSPAEIRLSILLRLNMRSKDIARVLRVTPDSVRIARYRLRKKLPIEQGDDLMKFILSI